MFDQHMICEDMLANITDNGEVVGYTFGARLPYYRGLGLSMIEDVAVTDEKIVVVVNDNVKGRIIAFNNNATRPWTSTILPAADNAAISAHAPGTGTTLIPAARAWRTKW